MILYRHAPNKAALLDGVAETVLAQLRVDSADPDWAGQLREGARRYRALALAHPHAPPRPPPRPGGARRAGGGPPPLPRAGAGPPARGAADRHPAIVPAAFR